jgi:hypothetical protein
VTASLAVRVMCLFQQYITMTAFYKSACVCVLLYLFVTRVACTFDLARVCISKNIRVSTMI